jgi:hypothetical protein
MNKFYNNTALYGTGATFLMFNGILSLNGSITIINN